VFVLLDQPNLIAPQQVGTQEVELVRRKDQLTLLARPR